MGNGPAKALECAVGELMQRTGDNSQENPVADERVLRGITLLQNAALIFDRKDLLTTIPANPFAPRVTVTARDLANDRSAHPATPRE